MQPSIDDPLAEAYADHSTELLAFLRRRVNCPQEAADLRQEVYLRLGETAPRRRMTDLRAYLYRIARNLLVDGHRSRAAEEHLFETEASAQNVASDEPSPPAAVAAAQELALLQSALDELPASLKHALLWYRMDGLTLREIGQRLGVSESMAGRYVNKALEHCESKLAGSV